MSKKSFVIVDPNIQNGLPQPVVKYLISFQWPDNKDISKLTFKAALSQSVPVIKILTPSKPLDFDPTNLQIYLSATKNSRMVVDGEVKIKWLQPLEIKNVPTNQTYTIFDIDKNNFDPDLSSEILFHSGSTLKMSFDNDTAQYTTKVMLIDPRATISTPLPAESKPTPVENPVQTPKGESTKYEDMPSKFHYAFMPSVDKAQENKQDNQDEAKGGYDPDDDKDDKNKNDNAVQLLGKTYRLKVVSPNGEVSPNILEIPLKADDLGNLTINNIFKDRRGEGSQFVNLEIKDKENFISMQGGESYKYYFIDDKGRFLISESNNFNGANVLVATTAGFKPLFPDESLANDNAAPQPILSSIPAPSVMPETNNNNNNNSSPSQVQVNNASPVQLSVTNSTVNKKTDFKVVQKTYRFTDLTDPLSPPSYKGVKLHNSDGSSILVVENAKLKGKIGKCKNIRVAENGGTSKPHPDVVPGQEYYFKFTAKGIFLISKSSEFEADNTLVATIEGFKPFAALKAEKSSVVVNSSKTNAQDEIVILNSDKETNYQPIPEPPKNPGMSPNEVNPVQPAEGVQPADPVQPAAVQPAAVQPAAVQPAAVQPAAVQPAQPAIVKEDINTYIDRINNNVAKTYKAFDHNENEQTFKIDPVAGQLGILDSNGGEIHPPKVWKGEKTLDTLNAEPQEGRQVHYVWFEKNTQRKLCIVTTDPAGKKQYYKYNTGTGKFDLGNNISPQDQKELQNLIRKFDESSKQQFKKQWKKEKIEDAYKRDKKLTPSNKLVKPNADPRQKQLENILAQFSGKKIAKVNMTKSEHTALLGTVERALEKEKKEQAYYSAYLKMHSSTDETAKEAGYVVQKFAENIRLLNDIKNQLLDNDFVLNLNKSENDPSRKFYRQDVRVLSSKGVEDMLKDPAIDWSNPQEIPAGEFKLPVQTVKQLQSRIAKFCGDNPDGPTNLNMSLQGQTDPSKALRNPLAAPAVERAANEAVTGNEATVTVMPAYVSSTTAKSAKGAILSTVGNTVTFIATAEKVETKTGFFEKRFSKEDVCEVNRQKIKAAVEALAKLQGIHDLQVKADKAKPDSFVVDVEGNPKEEAEILCKVLDACGVKNRLVGKNAYQKPASESDLKDYYGDPKNPDPSKLTVASIQTFLMNNQDITAKLAIKKIEEAFDLTPPAPTYTP